MIKKLLVYCLPLALLFCACATEEQNPGEEANENKPLKAAFTQNTPGYFLFGGESCGYPYELLKSWAGSRGIEIEAALPNRHTGKHLRKQKADVVVSLSTNETGRETLSRPLYSTNYVVLASVDNKALAKKKTSGGKKAGSGHQNSIMELMRESVVMVSPGFESTDSYNTLLDSLPTAHIYISPREGCHMAGSLADGDFDMLICEKSEALLAINTLRNIKCIHEYDEEVTVNLVFNDGNTSLIDDFDKWFEEYRASKDFESLNSLYFKKGFGRRSPTVARHNRVVGGISVWDDVMRKVGRSEGLDWRLLSAIAFHESRFRPEAVSRRGALGLMQIMPVVARQFGMSDRNLLDPHTNLTLASKLIKSMDNVIDFGKNTTPNDRLSITLAAYNSGSGNIKTARRLAAVHDENPDSWEVVAKYLVLMGDDSFDVKGVEYRRFNGSRETLAFVSNVMDRYDSYKRSFQ